MAKKKITELEEVQTADTESAITTNEDSAIPETDLEIAEAATAERPEGTSATDVCETEIGETTESAQDQKNSAVTEALSQTETDEVEITGVNVPESPEELEFAGIPQTEAEKGSALKKKRKTADKKSKTETEEDGSAVSFEPVKPKKRSAVKPRPSVVAIDDVRQVETDADKTQNDLLDLTESMKTGKILSGTIQGVERASEHNPTSLAVIYHGAFKVVIPALEAINPPDDYRGMEPDDVHHYLLTKRLGAEVDFVVRGIDAKSGIAIASRLDAMKIKRKKYYIASDRDGNHLLYEGVCAEARVVSVIRAGIFAEVFGAEVYIPLRELSYQRVMDASGYFQPGQRILVKIIKAERIDKENVKVTASVKQAAENPYEMALRRYTVGNRYVGTVSMVDVNGVFVSLDGGIDCLCSYPKRGRPPRGARVTVRILGINRETNRIWGAIPYSSSPR